MSTPTTFTLFPLLIPEIRLLIWEYAIQPRIITFSCELHNFNVRHAPQSLYLVGGDAPHAHFTIDVPQRPTSPYYLVQCYPGSVASPALLSTCHESRQVALTCGYKPWSIENQSLGTRDMMWNPALDVISLASIDKSQDIDEQCLDVFLALFPEQVREIQRLVVETDHWPPGRAARNISEWFGARIVEFSDLVEFAVLVEPYTGRFLVESYEFGGLIESYEKRSVNELEAAAEGVRRCLVTAKEQRMRKMKPGGEDYRNLGMWFPSRIRVIGNEDQVLSQE
jgi:hypothetical protein